MRELPIIYSKAMVLAKMAGRKTMTRRTVGLELINKEPDNWQFIRVEIGLTPQGVAKVFALFRHIDGRDAWLPCPYGKPGDVLYTRENLLQRNGMVAYNADAVWWREAGDFHYRYEEYAGIIPSIHMPKRAARIWDEVVSIRVERVHDITEADAILEGVQENICASPAECPSSLCEEQGCIGKGEYYRYPVDYDAEPCYSARESFETLWQSINGAESWNLNPWLWVISTKNLSTTGKPESLCSQQK